MKTIIRKFEFDTSTQGGREAWGAFKAEREAAGAKIFGPVLAEHLYWKLDGQEIDLETKSLFDNQWNTAPIPGVSESGLRVFDFYLQSDSAPHSGRSAPRGIRRGHYLDMTPEMLAIRRDTSKCGYCGKQEPTGRFVFCPHCIDSEYLKAEDLKLTRMRPVADSGAGGSFPELTAAEKAELLPKYRDAQLHGTTERGKARIAAERAKVIAKCDGTIRHATAERDGFLWFMDRGFQTGNLIYYSHTGRFSWGWRKPLSEDETGALLDVLSEFPFSYDLKTESRGVLSNA